MVPLVRANEGRLYLENPDSVTRIVDVHFEIDRVLAQDTARVQMDVANNDCGTIVAGEQRQPFHYRLELPPGKTTLAFHADGTRVLATDPRELVFRVWNVRAYPAGE